MQEKPGPQDVFVVEHEDLWVQRMADLEDQHGGFPGFTGIPGKVCPVCGLVTRSLVAHSALNDDPGHLVLHVLES